MIWQLDTRAAGGNTLRPDFFPIHHTCFPFFFSRKRLLLYMPSVYDLYTQSALNLINVFGLYMQIIKPNKFRKKKRNLFELFRIDAKLEQSMIGFVYIYNIFVTYIIV